MMNSKIDDRPVWRLLMGVLLCAAFWSLPAREASAAPTCRASMSALTFADVDLVAGGTYTASATLTYTCENDTNGTRYARLCFNIGDGSASQASGGGHWNPRILRDGSGNEMNLQFYQDAGSTIWGSSTQPISDPYDAPLTLPPRTGSSNPSVTTRNFTLRGVIISAGQAGLPPGLYQSDFYGNHTALRYSIASSSGAVPTNCTSVSTDGGTFGFIASANAVKSCQVSADPLDFGTVDGIASPTNIDATTTIRVICSKPTAYNVLLIPSNNNTGGSSAMTGAAGNTDTVPYRLYSNAARSAPWGSQAANDVSGIGNGLTQSLTVYGRVPGLPNVQPGNYKDTVTVNVTY